MNLYGYFGILIREIVTIGRSAFVERMRNMILADTHIADVISEVKKVVIGKDDVICKMMAAILMQGHILIDDIPGVGKTTMALAFAKSMDLQQKRMQFTPDVLPSDVTGYFMYDHKTGSFEYKAGPVMSELFLADEINRTSPKTQSALLEVMEERRVTIDGHTLQVPKPFIVIATQNPSGSAGTQPLPDSQMDRFMICLHMGYPGDEEEIRIIKSRTSGNPLNEVKSVMGKQELLYIQDLIQDVFIHDTVYEYMVELVNRTRKHDMVKLGVSPRGTLALTRMSQGIAFINGRDYVLPEDVYGVFKDVAAHRIFLNAKARVNQLTVDNVLAEILHSVKQPALWNERKKK